MRLLTREETTSYRSMFKTMRQIVHTGSTQDVLRLDSFVKQYRSNQIDIQAQQQLQLQPPQQRQPLPLTEPAVAWRQEGNDL